MRFLPCYLAVAITSSAGAQGDSCTASIANVAGRIGQFVVFCGTPSQLVAAKYMEDDPVYLYFGGKFPDHTFTVIIPGEVAGSQRNKLVKRYSWKKLRIKGEVTEHDGRPQVEVKAMKDVAIIYGAHGSKGVTFWLAP